MSNANSMKEYRRDVRRAMKWWRERNPDLSPFVTVRDHGWLGRVLWSVRGDAGAVMSVSELLNKYRQEGTACTPQRRNVVGERK